MRRTKHEGVLLEKMKKENCFLVSCVCTTVWESYGCEILKPTLNRMSVHIAFPWVIIGSWSSPFPSQQSSSTHLEAQSDYNTEPVPENQTQSQRHIFSQVRTLYEEHGHVVDVQVKTTLRCSPWCQKRAVGKSLRLTGYNKWPGSQQNHI